MYSSLSDLFQPVMIESRSSLINRVKTENYELN